MQNNKMGLIAHKGYSVEYQENTIEAFEESLKYKPIGIEMDIVLYNDEIYLYHPKTNNTSYGDNVDEDIIRELGQIERNGNLEEYRLTNRIFDLLNKVQFLDLDIKQKDSDIVCKLLEHIKRLRYRKDQIVVGARDIEKVRELLPFLEHITLHSLSSDPDSYTDYINEGVTIIRLWDEFATRSRINDIHTCGAKVWVTPGYPTTPERLSTGGEVTEERLLELQSLGVDAVLVNDLKMAREVLNDSIIRYISLM